MKPVGLALKLRPGCYAEYKKRHDELWPELGDVMRENGIGMT
ncbi:MAG: L-rhamnose mutarotase, partial [candidate division Zixibacteria bacterium]|nr:L-rhamnose mutarotase [candidate division Zixibacteria bacterium]